MASSTAVLRRPTASNGTGGGLLPVDPLSMTREDFEEFESTKLSNDQLAQELIVNLRGIILQLNQNGEFLDYRISPCVFSDDFLVRVSTFVQFYERELQYYFRQRITNGSVPINIEYSVKKRGTYSEIWMYAFAMTKTKGDLGACLKQPGSLPLLWFSVKDEEEDQHKRQVQEFIEQVPPKIKTTLEEGLPRSTVQIPIVCPSFSASNKHNTKRTSDSSGGELRAALEKAKALRAKGVYGNKKQRTTKLNNEEDGNIETGIVCQSTTLDYEDDVKQPFLLANNLPQAVVVRSKAEVCYDALYRCHLFCSNRNDNKKALGFPLLLIKGLLAAVVLYYIYAWVKPW